MITLLAMHFPISNTDISPVYLVVIGFLMGILGGFFGVGGSFIAGPALRAVADEAGRAGDGEATVALGAGEEARGMVDVKRRVHAQLCRSGGRGSNGRSRGLKTLPNTPRSPERWIGTASMAHSQPPARAQTTTTAPQVR